MITFSNLRKAKVLLAFSLLMMCSACGSTGTIELASKQAVVIPPAPKFLAPVSTPALKAGDDVRADLAKTTAALNVANTRLTLSRRVYNAMRQRYGGAKIK